MSREEGYQWETDTWIINGVHFNGEAFRFLTRADGRLLRITARSGKNVTVTEVRPLEPGRLFEIGLTCRDGSGRVEAEAFAIAIQRELGIDA
jgi:hypothetical protein